MAASSVSHNPAPVGAAAVAVNTGDRTRISWGSVFAGLVCAIASQALLTLLGLSWGFATIDPTAEVNPFAGLLLGGGLYWVITGIISMFAGGWIAARVSGVSFLPAGVIHGLIECLVRMRRSAPKIVKP